MISTQVGIVRATPPNYSWNSSPLGPVTTMWHSASGCSSGLRRELLAPPLLITQLKRSSPPARAKSLREALERAGGLPTWEEWDSYAEEVLSDDAAHVRSTMLRP